MSIQRNTSALLCRGLGALSFTLITPYAGAQGAGEIEQVVVTGEKTTGGEFGAKSGIPIDEVPQGVQVMSADDLTQRNVRSIGDALRAVPSANVGVSRVASWQSFSLRVRGFLADQMRNGVRQRYYEDVDASAISGVERIEVLKGPSSVLFGQSAVGGIISIVTKRPRHEFGGEMSGMLGSYDRKSAALDVTGPLSASNGLFFRATGEIERSGTFVDLQDEDRENASVSLTWQASDSVTAYVVTEWVERESLSNPGLPYLGTVQSNGVAPIPVNRFLGEPGYAPLKSWAPLVQSWADVKLSEHWKLTPRVSYSGFDARFIQTRVRSVQEDGVTLERNGRSGTENDNYTIGQLDLTGDFNALGLGHQMLLGVEYDRERATFLQYDLESVPSINVLNPVYAFTSAPPAFLFSYDFTGDIDGQAAYVQDIVDVTKRWNLILGVRASKFDMRSVFDGFVDRSSTDAFTYQLGSTFRLKDGWSLYAGFNTGVDLEYTASARNRSGEQFEPEESDQIETGIRYAGKRASGSASLFQIRRSNMLTPDSVDPDFSIQTGEVRVRGLEVEGNLQLTRQLFVQGGFARLHSEITRSNDGTQGAVLGDTPRNQASLFARYAFPAAHMEFRGGANYVGERTLVTGSSVNLPDYWVAAVGATYTLGATRVDLALNNLFDKTYFTASGNAFAVYPGDPRQVSVRLARQF